MPEVDLSIIVPAYNEEHRIGSTLAELQRFLAEQPYSSEVIVVDDGSRDATLAAVRDLRSHFANLHVIGNQHRGKAVAVQTGVFAARGRYVMFTDADLSAPLTELTKLLEPLEQGADVAIGSREGVGARRVGEPMHRHLMGRCFNRFAMLLLRMQFDDTQCGFKAFRRTAARRLFQQCRLYSDRSPVLTRSAVTAFDVEILFLALLNEFQVVEVPVEWHYRTGSKVNPVFDSFDLLADVLKIRWHSLIGHYKDIQAEQVVSSIE